MTVRSLPVAAPMGDAEGTSPRRALMEVLRRIDNGEDIIRLAVIVESKDNIDAVFAGEQTHAQSLGMLEFIKALVIKDILQDP